MSTPPLSIPDLLDAWLQWAEWVGDPERREDEGKNLLGWSEFDWVVQEHPEHAWLAILAAVEHPRLGPHLGTLAAGPMEDLLSLHGVAFIDRVEAAAATNPKIARLLGGVWKHETTDAIWSRVQAICDRRGWDGIPVAPLPPVEK